MTNLYDIPATESLSLETMWELIADVQDVPLTITTDSDGNEHVTYGKTPASEAGMERLTTAFIASIRKACRASKVLDTEDAFSVALTEFVAAVRRYDLGSDVPFSATIGTILRNKLSDADRTSDIIVIKENVAARYWRLMHKHDHDLQAAYEECRDTANGFDPSTFLAVHRALNVAAWEALVDKDGGAVIDTATAVRELGPEAAVVEADLVEWLFTRVDDRQETVLKLRYGFVAPATESLLVDSGFHLGEVLTDIAVAEVSGIGRATVQREKAKGLSLMREALNELIEEEA